jgi:hypothetical protein
MKGERDSHGRRARRTDLSALFEDDDANLLASLLGELFDPNGRAEPGGTGSDDGDVDLCTAR